MVSGTYCYGYVIWFHTWTCHFISWNLLYYTNYILLFIKKYHYLGSIGFNPSIEPMLISLPLFTGKKCPGIDIYTPTRQGIMKHWYTSCLYRNFRQKSDLNNKRESKSSSRGSSSDSSLDEFFIDNTLHLSHICY